jgi:hypothetical protein
MKQFRYLILIATAAILTATFAASALAAAPILIAGKYAGQASTKVEGDVANISASGIGKATVLGAGKITGQGTGDSSQQPCVPFGGTGTITGIAGTTISFKVITGANGCGDEGGHVFSIRGTLAVLKATGKLAKAKGTLRFTGVYDRDDGTFTVKLTGTLKK